MYIFLTKSLPLNLLVLLFSLSLFFTPGCSSESDYEEDNTSYEENDPDIDYGETDEPEEENPEDFGWRHGLLTIKFSLTQNEDTSSKDPDNLMRINSTLVMQANSSQDIWVRPDLSTILPSSASSETMRQAFESSPYYIDENASAQTINSHISFNKTVVIDSHDLNSKETTSGNGDITALIINNFQPSLYGDGYELDLTVHKNLHFTILTNSPTLNMNNTVEQDMNENLVFKLYPTPSDQLIKTYPYTDIEIEFNKKQQDMETLALFQKMLSEPKTVFLRHCIGSITKSDKDNLKISFSYTGKNWVPLVSGQPTILTDTVLSIDIEISAK